MSTEPDSTIPADFDLLAYISSGTIARREVVLWADEQAGSDLIEALAELKKRGVNPDEPTDEQPKDGPLSDGGDDDVDEWLAKAEGARDRLDASKSVWTVRAVSEDEARAAMKSIVKPKMPTPPKEGVAERLREAYQEKFVAYREAAAEAQALEQLAMTAVAVESVETAGGVLDGVTLAHLQAIRNRPGGAKWTSKLWAAVEDAQSSDPDVPRPTWLGRSTTSQG